MTAHNFHPHCGCSACGRTEESDERREELIDDMLADPKWRAANERAAEEWVAGTHSGEHYTEATLALDALHRLGATPDVMARLHRLARVESEALTGQLRQIAEVEIDRERAA